MGTDPSRGAEGGGGRGAARVRLLALDVDGVLTDGSVLIDDDGREIKRFNVRDGTGLRVWQRLGLLTAIVTGRSGRALLHRAGDLGIAEVVLGSRDKATDLAVVCGRLGVGMEEVAFVGDDLPDLGVMRRVGYPIAVGDADARILAVAAHVTRAAGGRGAVREAVEHLLEARGWGHRAAELYDSPG